MSTVKEIELAIEKLPSNEFWTLTDRLIARRNAEWDRQIEEDIRAGRLDKFAEEALREHSEGKSRPFPE
ncbi:MAG TPA: hypothetical protein PLX89_27840 [Verrucomicrobiota bacterium]|nr:hypothetical protein [Verrucomicrobiales bacterium]HRI16821.1 hypothetical protein [Verrucomicrobiota bacterium]